MPSLLAIELFFIYLFALVDLWECIGRFLLAFLFCLFARGINIGGKCVDTL
jgi:hypothetical protein